MGAKSTRLSHRRLCHCLRLYGLHDLHLCVRLRLRLYLYNLHLHTGSPHVVLLLAFFPSWFFCSGK